MSINVNDKSGLVESFTPGYEGCGCGNRRYYTKAEIDEMFRNVLDPEQIEKIVKEVVDEYVTSEEFSQVIISIIGEDYYTKAQIDTILEGYATKAWTTGDTDSRISTAMASETARTEDVYAKKTDVPSLDGYATTGWVDSQNYLKDITITINGDEVHNNGSIIIEGGGGEPVDISGKLDTTAFTQAMQSETARTEDVYAKKTDLDGKVDVPVFTAYTSSTQTWENNMEECCQNVNAYVDYLKYLIDDLQNQIDNITGSTPDTGDTPSSDKYAIITYNVTSTTEPTMILYTIEDVSSIETSNGTPVSVSQTYMFSDTGNQSLKFIYNETPSKRVTAGEQWSGLKQIVSATFNNIIPGHGAFSSSSLQSVTVRKADMHCFANCTGLTTVNYGNGFGGDGLGETAISTCVFSGCTALQQDFVVADGVKQIYGFSFRNSGITSITMPTSLTEIRNGAMLGCTNLNYVRFKGTTPPTVSDNGLGLSTYTFPIYVPSSAVNTYKQQLSSYANRIQAWTGQ